MYVSSFLHPHIHDRTVVQRDFTDLVKFTAFVYCQSKVQKKKDTKQDGTKVLTSHICELLENTRIIKH